MTEPTQTADIPLETREELWNNFVQKVAKDQTDFLAGRSSRTERYVGQKFIDKIREAVIDTGIAWDLAAAIFRLMVKASDEKEELEKTIGPYCEPKRQSLMELLGGAGGEMVAFHNDDPTTKKLLN